MNSFRKYLAELIGTFVLVVFGCGTACLVGCDAANGGGYVLTALAFGLVIVAMAYSIGNVSGCHINPAVSLGVCLTGGMKVVDFIGYVAAQCIGAVAGGAFLALIFNGKEGEKLYDQTGGLGSNGLAGVGDSWLIGLIVEVVLTFVFVLAILGVTGKVENGRIAGIVIGMTLTLVHILGIGLTGTSVNPARSLGPALFAGGSALSQLWVFIVGPLLGAAVAAGVHLFFKGKKGED